MFERKNLFAIVKKKTLLYRDWESSFFAVISDLLGKGLKQHCKLADSCGILGKIPVAPNVL